MFLGRPVDGGDVEVLSFRMNGALAELEFPTFTTGTIAGRPARNGNTIYGKVGATNFQESDSVQSIFSDSPDALLSSVEGIKILENGLQDIESFMGTLSDKEKWDALVAVQTEVIHIDPRDKGGYVITVGDLDIMSIAGTVDIYVPESQESNVDFGVGSTLLCVGSPWMSREGEARLSVTGWWCAESLTASSTSASNEAEGWD